VPTIDELVNDLAPPAVAREFVSTVDETTALECAIAWAHNEDPGTRSAAFVVLGVLALDAPAALDTLERLAEGAVLDMDARVRRAVVAAVGGNADRRGRDRLLYLANDPDPEVRAAVAGGLPLVLEDPTAHDLAVQTLIGLTKDAEVRVRDMAAFALGTQLDVDSPSIRAALVDLLSEPDTDDAYPAAEAAVGLARRHDPAVLPAIVSRLESASVGILWLQAAAELCDPQLLLPLLSLRGPDDQSDDPWVQALSMAILASKRN
jgi:HEAT repeat protein